MVRREGKNRRERRPQYRGAPGEVLVEHLLTPEEYFHKGRLFARCTLQPGSGVGYHEHHGEMESFYILSGQAQVTDEKGNCCLVGPGDTLVTSSGEGHSILAVGEVPLVYLAVILFQHDPA